MEMPMNKPAVWMLSGLLLAGCGESGPTGTLEARNDGSQLRLEMRAAFPGPVYSSGMDASSRRVVRTEAQWQALWTLVVRGHQPVPAVPAVDFSREMVVVAAMGSRPTGGYSITVDSVTAGADAIHAYVTERSPGRGCLTTQAFTAPVDAVAIPADGRAVRFHQTTIVHGCG
jgi:hypothetical protein